MSWKKNLICFLDCDGVLADFVGGCCKLLGLDREKHFQKFSLPYPSSLEKLFGIDGAERIYNEISVDFWVNLEKLPWADDLVALLDKHFGDNIYLCTSAGYLGSSKYFSTATAGKEKWIMRHFPRFKYSTIFCMNKKALASPRHILLDDQQCNIDSFNTGEGIGILFPAKWNYLWMHADDPLQYLKNVHFKFEG